MSQEDRDILADAYFNAFYDDPCNPETRDQTEAKVEQVMMILQDDLAPSVEWLNGIVSEINAKRRT